MTASFSINQRQTHKHLNQATDERLIWSMVLHSGIKWISRNFIEFVSVKRFYRSSSEEAHEEADKLSSYAPEASHSALGFTVIMTCKRKLNMYILVHLRYGRI